ncbi:hypothetical protein CPB86DRAFT_812548 [Serendipita vermifera]|nr:hypothetical protein CPB86DRAFT_812548 [Serendipita vermifera]
MNGLNLWKLKPFIPVEESDEKLSHCLKNSHLEEFATKMEIGYEIREYFFPNPPTKNVHIIVVPSYNSEMAGTDFGWAFPNERSGSVQTGVLSIPREYLFRAPAMYNLGMGNALPKDIQDRIISIHNAIRGLSKDIDFSDPTQLVMLPFPSPRRIPTKRFQTSLKEGLNWFQYMGRSKFGELKDAVEKNRKSVFGDKVFISGPVEGKRAVYIPDCSELAIDFELNFRIALCCAFYDKPQTLALIQCARDANDLIEVWKSLGRHYLIIDNLDALLYRPGNWFGGAKELARNCIWRLGCQRSYIYSANEIEPLHRQMYLTECVTVVPLNGGMSEAETDQWFRHYSARLPELTPLERHFVEYLTGGIPLLLCSLFRFKDKGFNRHEFMQGDDLLKVQKGIEDFFEATLCRSRFDKEQCLEFMMICLLLDTIQLFPQENSPDPRYFYVLEGIGHCTCGIVFETIARLFWERPPQDFEYPYWPDAVKKIENPIGKEFLAKRVCLTHISKHGLPIVAPELTKMETFIFQGCPPWKEQLKDGEARRLYVPRASRFQFIDPIILCSEPRLKRAHVYPIRMTFSSDPVDSEHGFYAEIWPSWIKDLRRGGSEIDVTFIWISKDHPAHGYRQPIGSVTKSGSFGVGTQPDHHSIHLDIREINAELGACLSTD